MNVSIREGVSVKRVKRALRAFKETLAEIHLVEFILHVPHSELLALVMVAIARPQGWVAIGFLAAGLTWWLRSRRSQEVVMDEHEADKRQESPVDQVQSGDLTFLAPTVPQNLVDVAKQGIGVKITIEIMPAGR